jgi:hypothetical protein
MVPCPGSELLINPRAVTSSAVSECVWGRVPGGGGRSLGSHGGGEGSQGETAYVVATLGPWQQTPPPPRIRVHGRCQHCFSPKGTKPWPLVAGHATPEYAHMQARCCHLSQMDARCCHLSQLNARCCHLSQLNACYCHLSQLNARYCHLSQLNARCCHLSQLNARCCHLSQLNARCCHLSPLDVHRYEVTDRCVAGLSALFLALRRRPVIRYQRGSDAAQRLAEGLYQLTYRQQVGTQPVLLAFAALTPLLRGPAAGAQQWVVCCERCWGVLTVGPQRWLRCVACPAVLDTQYSWAVLAVHEWPWLR